jgi:nitrite reductase/ring-hydroxylating ferredoxin subunit
MAIEETMSPVDAANPTSDPCGLATHQQTSQDPQKSSRESFFTEFVASWLKVRSLMFTRICKISEIQDAELYRYEVGEKTLLVARSEGRFVVTGAVCTHAEADLTLGIFTGKTITCPLHQAKFSLDSGAVLSGPDGHSPDSIPALKVYSTKVENGDLFADL